MKGTGVEPEDRQQLEAEHRPQAIEERIGERKRRDYISDAVLGSIDGSVTTFTVVASAVGGGFAGTAVVILGLAKLLADALSMAVSNYFRTRSQVQKVEEARRTEEQHIEQIPEGEQREIRLIFAQKGFEGEVLEEIVDTITRNRQLWVDTMLREEQGLEVESPDPLKAGVATFLAFAAIGFVSLIPFFFPRLLVEQAFLVSSVITALSFMGIGLGRGIAFGQPLLRSAIEVLLTGGAAAAVAYLVGAWLRGIYGVT